MALITELTEIPPPYDDDGNITSQPITLMLAGQSIYTDSDDAALLYQLNRGVANLTQATHKVELERVERTVKAATDEPTVKSRARHIYDLNYLKDAPGGLESLPSDSPHYFIQAVSKRTIGHIGLKKSRFRSHWTALPIDISGKNSSYGLPQYLKHSQPLFKVQTEKDKYKWTNGDGSVVAIEDEDEDRHRLIVTVSLHHESLDALVALWCCRVWQYSAEHAESLQEGSEGSMFPPHQYYYLFVTNIPEVRRKFRLAKESPAYSSTFLKKF